MYTAKFFLQVLVIGLLLALAGSTGVGLTQGPEPPVGEVQPEGEVSIAATVGSKFSYQGVLKENGSPVTGSRDMIFRLYSDDTCTTQVGSDIPLSGVPVTDGLFSVELAVTHDDFNGQGLWLDVEVGGTKIGCQEILPVPYALSLKPGAVISDTSSYVELNRFGQAGFPPAPSWKYGIYAEAEGTVANRRYIGVVARGTNAAIYGDGDVEQNLAGNGLVKAAVYVNCNDSMILGSIREFNNVTGSLFSYSAGSNAGQCMIDFGFGISGRFWVATAVGTTDLGVTCQLGSANDQLNCFRYDASSGAGSNGNIMVLLY